MTGTGVQGVLIKEIRRGSILKEGQDGCRYTTGKTASVEVSQSFHFFSRFRSHIRCNISVFFSPTNDATALFPYAVESVEQTA